MFHGREDMKLTPVSKLGPVCVMHGPGIRALMHVSKACLAKDLPPLEAARVHAWMLGSRLGISREERYAIDRVVCLALTARGPEFSPEHALEVLADPQVLAGCGRWRGRTDHD